MKPLTIIAPALFLVTTLFIVFFVVYYGMQVLPYHAGNKTLSEQHRTVMYYLNIPLYEPDNLGFMEPREQDHMHDVKVIFNWVFFLGILLCVTSALLARKMDIKEMNRASKWTGYGLVGAIVIVVLLTLFGGFEQAWVVFHLILFPQGNWMFNRGDVLITLYPLGYFLGFCIAMVVVLLALGITFILTAGATKD